MRYNSKFVLACVTTLRDRINFSEEKDFNFTYSHPEKNKISNSYEKVK